MSAVLNPPVLSLMTRTLSEAPAGLNMILPLLGIVFILIIAAVMMGLCALTGVMITQLGRFIAPRTSRAPAILAVIFSFVIASTTAVICVLIGAATGSGYAATAGLFAPFAAWGFWSVRWLRRQGRQIDQLRRDEDSADAYAGTSNPTLPITIPGEVIEPGAQSWVDPISGRGSRPAPRPFDHNDHNLHDI